MKHMNCTLPLKKGFSFWEIPSVDSTDSLDLMDCGRIHFTSSVYFESQFILQSGSATFWKFVSYIRLRMDIEWKKDNVSEISFNF